MNLTIVTPTTGTPVTLEEAKRHLLVTTNDQLVTLAGKLKAATKYCQQQLSGHRQFMAATYDWTRSSFPANNGRITFPLPPLGSTSITVSYFDEDGASQTFGSTKYDVVNPTDDPGYIEPAYDEEWPSTRDRIDAVTLRFVAGYSSAANVPEPIKEAILLKTEHLWDPERVSSDEIDRAIRGLLAGYDCGHYD
jgi:uncharacterized phiE125 gp8 family phage protein